MSIRKILLINFIDIFLQIDAGKFKGINLLTRNYGANVLNFVRMLVNWKYVETLGKMITWWSYTSWIEWQSTSMCFVFSWSCYWMYRNQNIAKYKKKKVYLKVLKQRMQKWSFVESFQWSLIVQRQKYFDSQPTVEGSVVVIKVVCVFFGGVVTHSLMIQPSFLH